MHVIQARNVNDALATALRDLQSMGTVRSSRNGTVLAFPTPVSTVYSHPQERVLFSPMRNANPLFHLLESFWMLAGRNDVRFPATFVKNMKNFSDDGKTFHGAYGHRWRQHFGYDQIAWIIDELNANPESRRCVLQMWDPGSNYEMAELASDLYVATHGGKDVPCNTNIYFDRRDGRLNMTVCCRSNDILWGCYGANVVHMSMLQEYMAAAIGCQMGTYTQMSNDLHLYTAKTPEQGILALADDCDQFNSYGGAFRPVNLIRPTETIETLDRDIAEFFRAFDLGEGISAPLSVNYETHFFDGVVKPMYRAWTFRKTLNAALEESLKIRSFDWGSSMDLWLASRHHGFGVKS